MKPLFPTLTALLLCSTAASAELTPQDIFTSWRGVYAGFGATISTSDPVVTGNTTRFPDVIAQMNMADTETSYVFDWVEMQRTSDGSLAITFSPNGHVSSLANVTGETLASRASYDLGSLTINADGTPEDIRYTYSAAVITVQQSQSMPDREVSVSTALQNLQGQTRTQLEEGQISESGSHSIDSLTATITFDAQNKPSYLDYRAEDLTIEYDLGMPRLPVPQTASSSPSLYPDGMVFGITFGTGPATTIFTQNTEQGKSVFTFTQAIGGLTAAYDTNALSYGITTSDTALALENTPAQMVDFTAAFEHFNFGVTVPIRKSDTPSPFALALALENLTLGNEVWTKFDPNSTLSQAPASLAFSINGTAKLFADLFDRSALTALRGAPFELRSLSLESLNLSLEGMGLTGDGNVTFNNDRVDPLSGLPEPTGVLDFSINGALGLLDKVGRLGFFEPLAIIGAKGALGMFATPSTEADSFTSRIEFTDGGHVSVNGQQVK